MNVLLQGLNHRTAPVEVRERYAVAPARCRTVNEKLVAHSAFREAAVISTCNRTEVVVVAESIELGREALASLFAEVIGDGSAAPEHLYLWMNREAVAHVFRVAGSLDSMVLGEPQILGQVKQAYAIAAESGSCGPILSRLFHRAFRAAKRVRAETGLGATAVSVARVGVQLAREIFESLAEKHLLLVGAGEIAESALRGFHEAGMRRVVIMNRTLEAAVRLAEPLGAHAASLATLEDELVQADVLVSSVAVERPLISRDLVERSLRQRQQRALLLIDLGVPRNIDPGVKEVDDAYLYDVDDLEQVAERGRAERRSALPPAEAILALELEQFERWQAGRRAVPTIRQLREHARGLALAEAKRTLARLPEASEQTRAGIERMAEAIVAKLLHRPLDQLRAEAADGETSYYAEAVREIFGLEEEEE